jgi:hypothetical protein
MADFSSPTRWQSDLMARMLALDIDRVDLLRQQAETAETKVIDEDRSFLVRTSGPPWRKTLVRDQAGRLQLNPLYQQAMRSAGGTDWKGVSKDAGIIGASIALYALRGIKSVLGGLGFATFQGGKASWNVIPSCNER